MSNLREQLKQQSRERKISDKVTQLVQYQDTIEEKGHYWENDKVTYKDNKGWNASVYLDSIEKKPYLVRFAGPEGEEYIINTTSLRGNDGIEDRKNSPAASKVLENLRETLDQGNVSIEDLTQKYDKYKVQDYPDDIKDKVAKQNSINSEL